MGVLPPWSRPLIKRLIPWYSRGNQSVQHLAGLAIAAVAKRSHAEAEYGAEEGKSVDLLSKLQAGRDEEGNLMSKEELSAEALTHLIAGSDTTAK